MPLFNDTLGSGESLIKNEDALDFDFVPKILPYREQQQRLIADCIKPLLQKRNGRNALIYGPPGVGKTAACRWVLRDLEETTDEVKCIYINCWQKNTSHKIVLEICEQLGYAFVQNKKTEELFKVITEMLNKTQVVIVLDEIDKLDEIDILYSLLNEIWRKTILLITNYKETFTNLDERIRSRLTPEIIEFTQYNLFEITGILRERIGYAFVPGCWQDDSLKIIADKSFEKKDVRSGIYLLRQAALAAEDESSKRIKPEHAKKAVSKLADFTVKNSAELDSDSKMVLLICRENSSVSGRKIGELYEIYRQKGGMGSYKLFQRRIDHLAEGNFIVANKTAGGTEGNTTVVFAQKEKDKEEKKLDEF